jgi:drug/metabolite transporter (DMT)-like permease
MHAWNRLSPTLRGSLLIVLGASFAGVLGPLARGLYDQGMEPFAFVVWRGVIAGTALWLIVLLRSRRDPTYRRFALATVPRRQRLARLAFAATNVILNTSLFVAFDRIPIAVALLTFYTYPVLLALYGRATGTESLGPIKIAALAVSLLGLALVVSANFDPASGVSLDPLGLALGIVASVTAAAWIGFGRACPAVPAEQAMGIALSATVATVGLAAVVVGPASMLRFPVDHPDAWPVILVSGLLSGAGSAVLFTMGIRLISRVRAGILGLIEPIMGTVAAALLLGQVLTPIQLLGGAFVLGAAVLIQRDSDEPAIADESELPAPAAAL